MVRSEKDLLRQRLLKAEEELDILRPERDKLRQLLSQAEEELDIVRSQKDAFRRLLSEVESKNLQKKLSYVDDYEREKMKRMNLVSLLRTLFGGVLRRRILCVKAQQRPIF